MSKLKILKFFKSFLSYQPPGIITEYAMFVTMVLFVLYCDSIQRLDNTVKITDENVAAFINGIGYAVRDIYDDIVDDNAVENAPQPDEGYQE